MSVNYTDKKVLQPVEERAKDLFAELDILAKGTLTKQQFIDAFIKR